MPFALRSQRVITNSGERPATVVIDGEKIVDVTDRPPEGVPLTDLRDLVLAPGLVDAHVHINEPGRTEWEGYATATAAAAAGGITTVVDMPLNCTPVTTTRVAFAEKLQHSEPQLHVDCAYWGGVVPENTEAGGAALAELLDAGVVGAKCFLVHSGIDDFPNVQEAALRVAMPLLRERGLPLLVHAELEGEADACSLPPQSYERYLASRPRDWEDRAIALMIDLCRETGCAVHIVHLSSASAIPMLRDARREGLPITVETCPHYLCLSAEDIEDGATAFKCAPPIREQANANALWEGLRDGVIDQVVSDHSPCTPALKLPERGDFLEAWGGIASLQLGLSSVWTQAEQRGFSPADLSRWMATHPAQLIGLGSRKGAIAPGYDADLIAWDPAAEFAVRKEWLRHRHPITPYLGKTLRGQVRTTWLRGERIFHDDALANTVSGQSLFSPNAKQPLHR